MLSANTGSIGASKHAVRIHVDSAATTAFNSAVVSTDEEKSFTNDDLSSRTTVSSNHVTPISLTNNSTEETTARNGDEAAAVSNVVVASLADSRLQQSLPVVDQSHSTASSLFPTPLPPLIHVSKSSPSLVQLAPLSRHSLNSFKTSSPTLQPALAPSSVAPPLPTLSFTGNTTITTTPRHRIQRSWGVSPDSVTSLGLPNDAGTGRMSANHSRKSSQESTSANFESSIPAIRKASDSPRVVPIHLQRDAALIEGPNSKPDSGAAKVPGLRSAVSALEFPSSDPYTSRVSQNAMSVTKSVEVVPQRMMLLPPRAVTAIANSIARSTTTLKSPSFPPVAKPSFPSNSNVSSSPSSPLNYEVHEGRNLFLCQGAFVLGPGWRATLNTFCAILIPGVLFLAFPARTLYQRGDGISFLAADGTPVTINADLWDTTSAGLVSLLGGSILLFSSLLWLLSTALNDPGIIPRLRFNFAHESTILPTEADSAQMHRVALVKQMNANRPRAMVLVLHAMGLDAPAGAGGSSNSTSESSSLSGASFPTELKYCDSCEIHRPPRTVHCGECDNCVEKFDHHCPWIGTCVGLRNYRYFHLFLCSLSSLMLLLMSICCFDLHVRTEDDYYRKMAQGDDPSRLQSVFAILRTNPLSLILLLVCFFFMWFVVPLTFLHIYLVSIGQTTNEFLKKIYRVHTPDDNVTWDQRTANGFNPFHRGCIKNWIELFWHNPVGVDSHLQPSRDATLHPVLPSANSMPITTASNNRQQVASKYETQFSSAMATDVEAHGRVRFVDVFEMEENEDHWKKVMRAHKSGQPLPSSTHVLRDSPEPPNLGLQSTEIPPAAGTIPANNANHSVRASERSISRGSSVANRSQLELASNISTSPSISGRRVAPINYQSNGVAINQFTLPPSANNESPTQQRPEVDHRLSVDVNRTALSRHGSMDRGRRLFVNAPSGHLVRSETPSNLVSTRSVNSVQPRFHGTDEANSVANSSFAGKHMRHHSSDLTMMSSAPTSPSISFMSSMNAVNNNEFAFSRAMSGWSTAEINSQAAPSPVQRTSTLNSARSSANVNASLPPLAPVKQATPRLS